MKYPVLKSLSVQAVFYKKKKNETITKKKPHKILNLIIGFISWLYFSLPTFIIHCFLFHSCLYWITELLIKCSLNRISAGRKCDPPEPPGAEPRADALEAERAAPDAARVLVCSCVWGGEGRHEHGVSQWLVAWRVDHVPQCLLWVLDASSLWITVTQEDELLLLSCPQPTHTLFIDLTEEQRGA